MIKRSLTKRQAQYRHFQLRMSERYGLAVNAKACREIINYICQGKAELIRKDTNRVKVFSVPFLPELRKINSNRIISLDDRLLVLFDNLRHQLVTCGEEIKEPVIMKDEQMENQDGNLHSSRQT